MASSSMIKISQVLKNWILGSLVVVTIMAVMVSSLQFQVDWVRPTPTNHTESFNHWATTHRFHIGDSLHFKYVEGDSVLVVNSSDYKNCITSPPVSKFEGGNSTVFQFERSGFFYFISGQPGHCKAGQRLVIRVIHPSEAEEVDSPPPTGRGEDIWDSPPSLGMGPTGAALNSTDQLTVVSYFITFLGGVIVFLYYCLI